MTTLDERPVAADLPTATLDAYTPPGVITRPGVYDLPEDAYHRDPVPSGSLSSTGARKLISSPPAIFDYERRHGQPRKKAWDFGTAAHAMVLGTGAPLVVVDVKDWTTKAAREQRDAAYADGAIPLLPHEHQQIKDMAAALAAHPVASALLAANSGRPEQSLFWQDKESGIWCRARLDFLPNPENGRLLIADFKTCRTADPKTLEKAIEDYGYHQQAAWYLDGANALRLGEDPQFLFIAQEKTPPYLITVFGIAESGLQIARELNRKAINTYVECTRTNYWPGYPGDIHYLSIPSWAEQRHYQEMS